MQLCGEETLCPPRSARTLIDYRSRLASSLRVRKMSKCALGCGVLAGVGAVAVGLALYKGVKYIRCRGKVSLLAV